jgi:hypothetical protein
VSEIAGTKKSELEEIASVIKEVREKVDDKKLEDVVKSNQKVLEKLDGVKDLSDTFTTGLNKLEKIFEKDVFRDVAINSEQSASALNSMNKHMEALLVKFDNISIAAPPSKSTPKEPDVEAPATAKNDSRKVKKVKFFSSSVALGCNKKKLENELDCDLEFIETYHIVENPTAPDPEKYLNNMLTSHLIIYFPENKRSIQRCKSLLILSSMLVVLRALWLCWFSNKSFLILNKVM